MQLMLSLLLLLYHSCTVIAISNFTYLHYIDDQVHHSMAVPSHHLLLHSAAAAGHWMEDIL